MTTKAIRARQPIETAPPAIDYDKLAAAIAKRQSALQRDAVQDDNRPDSNAYVSDDIDDDAGEGVNVNGRADNVLAHTDSRGWSFPATQRKLVKGKMTDVPYKVNPVNRKAFMLAADKLTFGAALSLTTFDDSGKSRTATYPANCTITAKQFASGNHGLYGRVESVTVTLPNGEEYVLSGQVNLQLTKRNH